MPEDSSGHRQIIKQIAAAVSSDNEGQIGVTVYQEKTPMEKVDAPLSDPGIPFESSNSIHAMHWVAFPVEAGVADRYELRLDIYGGINLFLWGLRLIYEKGGIVR